MLRAEYSQLCFPKPTFAIDHDYTRRPPCLRDKVQTPQPNIEGFSQPSPLSDLSLTLATVHPHSTLQSYGAVCSAQIMLFSNTPMHHTWLSVCLQTHLCPQILCLPLYVADSWSSLRQGSPSLQETVPDYGSDHSWFLQNFFPLQGRF